MNENTTTPSQESENQGTENEMEQVATPDELTVLKARAKLMGISHSPNIGVETLKAKIQEKMAAEEKAEQGRQTPDEDEMEPVLAAKPVVPSKAKTQTLRQKLMAENMRLIRIRITNMDPKKKDLPGEIFTVANEYIGTVRKYVPYGEMTESGYHVPYCIYKLLKNRKFLNIRTIKGRNGERDRIETNWAQEFALEVMDPLTPVELKQLATAQMAAGNL